MLNSSKIQESLRIKCSSCQLEINKNYFFLDFKDSRVCESCCNLSKCSLCNISIPISYCNCSNFFCHDCS